MINVLFMHGWQSSDQSNKFTSITAYPAECPNVDHSDPAKVKQTYEDFITGWHDKHLDNSDDKLILFGHSFGGFWARYLGLKYNIPYLIINPSLQPWVSMADEMTQDALDYLYLLDKDRQYLDTQRGSEAPFLGHMIFEKGDEVLDYQMAVNDIEANDTSTTFDLYEGGHHRFSRLELIDKELRILGEDDIH